MRGTDYGNGTTNIDKETGIRFGVIPIHLLSDHALDRILLMGKDVAYEAACKAIRKRSRGANRERLLEDLAENWDSEFSRYVFEGDCGLVVTHTPGSPDAWVIKSPFFTHCEFCSPCAPGAGYLASPDEDGPKTYCLDGEWFNDSVAPYPVHSVKTGELV